MANLRGAETAAHPMDDEETQKIALLKSRAALIHEQLTWNTYRYLGDYLHLFGRFVLLVTIWKNKSVRGLSRSTQVMHASIFLCRYLDLVTHSSDQVAYLVIFKVTYITTSLIVLALFAKMDSTYERQKDTCSLFVIIVPCIIAAILLTPASDSPVTKFFWALSQFLEGFAMVPQYIFCYRDKGARDWGVMLYVVSIGGYRVLYAANWIFKKLYEPVYSDIQSWLGGIIEIAFFCDYLLSFSGFSVLRAVVLNVDEKINLISEKVEMKVLGRASEAKPAAETELRQRRRGPGEDAVASDI